MTALCEHDGTEKNAEKQMAITFTDLRSTLRTHWKSIYVLTIVSIIGVIQMSTVVPQVFPYMKQLDNTVSPTFYGYMGSISSLAHVLAAAASGWVSNKINQTKAPIVSGKVCAIVSCIVYLSVEYFRTTMSQRTAFIVYEIFAGLSVGAVGILRAYVAMASTDEDRSRAISITTMAMPLGIAIGPVIQLAFTALSYPGYDLPTGGHLNMYTAPVIFSLTLNIGALLLLIIVFKDKTTATRSRGSIRPNQIIVNKDDFEDSTMSSVSSTATTKSAIDWFAVATCLITRLVIGLILINNRIVATPYTMMIFKWSSADTVFYHSLSMALIGIFGIFVHLVYIFTKITEKIPERLACTVGCMVFVSYFLLTYPWPFLPETLKSESIPDVLDSKNFNLTLPDTTDSKHPVVLSERTGCTFSWCDDTPAVNFYVYFIGAILTLGTGLPIVMMNLDILFSRLLGNIKQGTMQGVFMVSGDVVNIIGPIFLSTIYEATGPTYIWMFLIVCTSACALLWIVMYHRMLPNRGARLQ
ncbi:hypothetical protein QR680_003494 [Steinernema hermaphroditum]|uniref:Major facilitator superfamily (MFS) profile domain-containing protein n=1 Tax=Steinernema hermaphroditum TaxID=289476 RepID=A0AA39HKL7_9BILA|nr:hypothetical protein QR680_003494 [Steinernema hermaphroditum]